MSLQWRGPSRGYARTLARSPARDRYHVICASYLVLPTERKIFLRTICEYTIISVTTPFLILLSTYKGLIPWSRVGVSGVSAGKRTCTRYYETYSYVPLLHADVVNEANEVVYDRGTGQTQPDSQKAESARQTRSPSDMRTRQSIKVNPRWTRRGEVRIHDSAESLPSTFAGTQCLVGSMGVLEQGQLSWIEGRDAGP